MKKIFSLILALVAIALPMMADGSDQKPASLPITLSSHPIDPEPNPTIHRAPMRICVEAYYDALSKTISIYYAGETTGEVALHRDGELIDNSSEINTTFMATESGYYTIEINTEAWTATGSIEI